MARTPCMRLAIAGLLLASTRLPAADAQEPHAMGSIPCSWSVPIQDENHNLDVPATIRLLRANHFTCYVQPIEEKPPMSFDDLIGFFRRRRPAVSIFGRCSFLTPKGTVCPTGKTLSGG